MNDCALLHTRHKASAACWQLVGNVNSVISFVLSAVDTTDGMKDCEDRWKERVWRRRSWDGFSFVHDSFLGVLDVVAAFADWQVGKWGVCGIMGPVVEPLWGLLLSPVSLRVIRRALYGALSNVAVRLQVVQRRGVKWGFSRGPYRTSEGMWGSVGRAHAL